MALISEQDISGQNLSWFDRGGSVTFCGFIVVVECSSGERFGPGCEDPPTAPRAKAAGPSRGILGAPKLYASLVHPGQSGLVLVAR